MQIVFGSDKDRGSTPVAELVSRRRYLCLVTLGLPLLKARLDFVLDEQQREQGVVFREQPHAEIRLADFRLPDLVLPHGDVAVGRDLDRKHLGQEPRPEVG
jgi:hypothetical protein